VFSVGLYIVDTDIIGIVSYRRFEYRFFDILQTCPIVSAKNIISVVLR